MISEQPPRRI
uniref:Uncharacterized protein n=1 Tax=Arundo donax TaxID=35708 RepID=A0A0A8YJ76_ARUDO